MRWLRRRLGRGRYHRAVDELTQLLGDGAHAEAARKAEQCLSLAESMFGPDHDELVGPLYALASARLVLGLHDEAAAACGRAIAIAGGGGGDVEPPLHQLWEQRAAIADRAGDEEAFASALREVIDAAADSPAVRAAAHNRLGLLLGRAGRFAEAADQFESALELRARDDPESLGLAEVLHNQATFRDPEGDAEAREAAASAFERALKIAARHLTPEASLLEARVAHNFGVLRQDQLKDDEAETLYRRALAAFERDHAPDDPVIRPTLARLGRLLQASRRFGEAVEILKRAHDVAEKELGPEHEITGRIALWLGDANSHTYR
jgi:tetratricopeptide (TPR) repeat protein